MILQGQTNADAMQMQGVAALGQGIGHAGQDIGNAMQKLNEYHQAQQQATGTVAAAASMGILKPEDVAAYQNMPLFQQVGYAHDIAPMMQAQGMLAYHQMIGNARMMNAQTAQDRANSSPAVQTMNWQ